MKKAHKSEKFICLLCICYNTLEYFIHATLLFCFYGYTLKKQVENWKSKIRNKEKSVQEFVKDLKSSTLSLKKFVLNAYH